jgi:hypothetical protein
MLIDLNGDDFPGFGCQMASKVADAGTYLKHDITGRDISSLYYPLNRIWVNQEILSKPFLGLQTILAQYGGDIQRGQLQGIIQTI